MTTEGSIDPFDTTKSDPTIAFKGILLKGDCYITTRTITRESLSKCKKIKLINEEDYNFIFTDSTSPETLEDLTHMLNGSILVYDDEKHEHLIIQKDCYWW